jgi:hypothetical protein
VAQNGPTAQEADMPQLGSPYALPKLVELGLVKYIIETQESEIGVNVTQIKQQELQLSDVTSTKISN